MNDAQNMTNFLVAAGISDLLHEMGPRAFWPVEIEAFVVKNHEWLSAQLDVVPDGLPNAELAARLDAVLTHLKGQA